MRIFKEKKEINSFLSDIKKAGNTLGCVPTMGALHSGHLELVKRSVCENNFTVVSIFVNPTQFNNKEDLDRYPRTLQKDIDMLSAAGCSVVFVPEISEMYETDTLLHMDFGVLDKILEGEFRPGHFNGVATIVDKLFSVLIPDKAYFGEKDFQQLCIVTKLAEALHKTVEIVPCPIVRESDGLAMSSRNVLLEDQYRKNAGNIYNQLKWAKSMKNILPAIEIKSKVKEELNKQFRVEYFEIVNPKNFLSVENFTDSDDSIALVALFAGKVRLIDNIRI